MIFLLNIPGEATHIWQYALYGSHQLMLVFLGTFPIMYGLFQILVASTGVESQVSPQGPTVSRKMSEKEIAENYKWGIKCTVSGVLLVLFGLPTLTILIGVVIYGAVLDSPGSRTL